MEDHDEVVTPRDTEEQRIEVWKWEQLDRWDFDSEAIAKLLEWGVDLHDVERLLFRNGVRTKCSHELALAILSPVPLVELVA